MFFPLVLSLWKANSYHFTFAESEETLRKADKQEITRLLRQKAKTLHPDTSGDHEQFVRLTEAYEELLRSKN